MLQRSYDVQDMPLCYEPKTYLLQQNMPNASVTLVVEDNHTLNMEAVSSLQVVKFSIPATMLPNVVILEAIIAYLTKRTKRSV